MAFFDFIKKKELGIIHTQQEVITSKNKQIKEQEETIQVLKQEMQFLQIRVKELEPYQSIVDTDKEIAQKIANADKDIAERLAAIQKQESHSRQLLQEHKQQIDDLQLKYSQGLEVYEKLKKETEIYRESLEMAEYGIYEPHFDFDTSEEYQNAILAVRNSQKTKVQAGIAVIGGEGTTLNKSLLKGRRFVKQQKKLMLRAFNGECDSFISEVDWNNVVKMQIRIEKSFEAINKIYESQGIKITEEYKQLKINELQYTYEYKQKRHEEKEEQRAIRKQMREEEKARREIEGAMIKAQKEEERYQKALDKARKEVSHTTGTELYKLRIKITELESRLTEAGINKERALSMAQQTKRGHVYVISNIGSFGENMYKIGMTRRLDPMDRIKELGDASVPFPFDVHAIIFSEDAPALETQLHRVFDERRVNLVNPRKEFYAVSLQEIEDEVHKNDEEIEFTKLAEARDYRESIAIRESKNQKRIDVYNPEEDKMVFPQTLFAS